MLRMSSHLWRVSLGACLLGVVLAGGIRWFMAERGVPHARFQQMQRLLVQRDSAAAERVGLALLHDPAVPIALRDEVAWKLGNAASEQPLSHPAVAYYLQISEASSYKQAAGAQIALSLLGEGQLQAAEQWMVQHLQRFPDDQAIRSELRWTYFNQYRTRELEALLLSRIELQQADQYRWLIDLLTGEFRHQLAREGLPYLQRIDQRVPGQRAVQLALGTAYWQIGELPQAEAYFAELAQTSATDWNTGLILAEYALEQGQVDIAAALLQGLRPAIAQSPAPITADRWWYLDSLLLEARGQRAEQAEALAQARALRPSELEYLQKSGSAAQQSGVQPERSWPELAHQQETIRAELSELVLRGLHERPSVTMCLRLAELETTRGRTVAAAGWKRFAAALKIQTLEQLLAPPTAPLVLPPGGGGAM